MMRSIRQPTTDLLLKWGNTMSTDTPPQYYRNYADDDPSDFYHIPRQTGEPTTDLRDGIIAVSSIVFSVAIVGALTFLTGMALGIY